MRRVYLRRRIVALAGVAAIAALIVIPVSQGGGSGATRASGPAHGPSKAPAPAPASAPAPARTRRPRLPALSLEQLAGQRIIYAYSGLTPPESLLAVIRAGEAAGVILFGSDVSSTRQTLAAVRRLQQANADAPVHAPLLILTDQEGGEVRRLPGAPTLSERAIGQSVGAVTLASEAGAGAAQTLAAAGVNVNLSPVLDVRRQPGGFIDEYARSYGPDASEVARLGRAFIINEQRHGVAATAKHFPGLGAARRGQDTDSRPVTLHMPLAELRAVDEVPYPAAIAAGVKLVMTSWAVYPALDASSPAGFSTRVMQGELRGRLGYRGVTITDTLSAAALTRFGSLAQRGVLAARAGADLLICSAIDGDERPTDGIAVRHAVASAIAGGEIDRPAAEESAARVLSLRRTLGG
jgi:beta-N-acetylhexosaminidase